ncbi:MAG: hypothetical protein KBT53_08050 [Porticoccus sp.]|nr:hypothetical protein [Porticoccus sp.]MBQ0808338.1 hypothetical protein [Porticoccus sp.]
MSALILFLSGSFVGEVAVDATSLPMEAHLMQRTVLRLPVYVHPNSDWKAM